jgi:hypothetical protein
MTKCGEWRSTWNLLPLPYRRVSVQPFSEAMTESSIVSTFLGREAYRRTDFVVLEGADSKTAVIAIERASNDALFSQITAVEVIALPDRCRFVHLPAVDTANRSAMAEAAHELGVGEEDTLVVQGLYDHVNFLYRSRPKAIRVVEVTPPDPPKLLGLARQVLSYAELPPIRLVPETIRIRDLALKFAEREKPSAFLVPCCSGGLDDLPAPVYHLDKRPERHNWTMIGCERSLQFHEHFYKSSPPRLEMCPRKLAGPSTDVTLLKCCMLETNIECQDNLAVVPWGADLRMVADALRWLSEGVPYA